MRLARLTIRARLTLVYGGLFLVAGLVLLGVTYVLVQQRVSGAEPGSTTQISEPGVSADGSIQTLTTTVANEAKSDALGALLTQGGIALVVVGGAATALGWLLAGRLLQPLHRMTDTARRIADAPVADRGLHERIALDGPDDEIKQLADTFDVMIARLDHSFAGQRTFVANASHELRTPLTLNRALIEVALHRPNPSAETVQLGETLLEINSRHERLIDGLLLLTKAQPEVLERSYVDLADLVEHVAGQLPPGPVTVRTMISEAPTTGNPVLLERVVQNLIENGIRHNLAQGGWVDVRTLTRPDGVAVLVVSNTGPVIPRYEIAGLFEPFRRYGAERLSTPGAGLGLSIVQAIARAHDGDVGAEPRAGGGLSVTVSFPAA